ncbi:CaiB/BaiF CoA transferase family protein [Paraburkholderia sediminicola]|uniref:CaiB/BaiF CoA transferase family protein n=1 Tax=Paraburkholderia sediminicola TaxID=458836 RepID=UPI0038BB2FA6
MTPLDSLVRERITDGLKMLDGVRVLDLTSSIAGPYGTQLLADLGASVTKIEKVEGGDDTRGWGPPFLDGASLWYLSVNRNKESVTLDIQRPEGRAILDELIGSSDVFVVNLVQRAQQRLGIDAGQLRAKHPHLIHVSLTGFGLSGAHADLPCYDLIAEGYSGIMDLTGEAHGGPQKVGTPAADLLAGQDLALATLAALYERKSTGRGRSVDVSMVASAVRFMAPRIVPFMGSGQRVTRSGGRDSVLAVYQVFDTADEPITLGLGNDAIWRRFWSAVGRDGYGNSDAYASNEKRREAREQIVEVIAHMLRTQPRAHWLALFAEHRIPAGPINRIDQVIDDPCLQDRNMFYAVEGARGWVPQVGLGIRFDGKGGVHRRAPPTLGEDTERVLRQRLGMSEACVAGLKDAGIV